MGFTFILTCVERPPVIPNQRLPYLVKSIQNFLVLKTTFIYGPVAKTFSHKCPVIYACTASSTCTNSMTFELKVHVCTNSITYEQQTICKESFIVVSNSYCLQERKTSSYLFFWSFCFVPFLRDHLQYKTTFCLPRGGLIVQRLLYQVSQWMCTSHGILNWVMSVGSSICTLVCVLFDESSVLAIPIQMHF